MSRANRRMAAKLLFVSDSFVHSPAQYHRFSRPPRGAKNTFVLSRLLILSVKGTRPQVRFTASKWTCGWVVVSDSGVSVSLVIGRDVTSAVVGTFLLLRWSSVIVTSMLED